MSRFPRHALGVLETALVTLIGLVLVWTSLYAIHVDTEEGGGELRVLDCMVASGERDLFLVPRATPAPETCFEAPFYAYHPVWYSLILAGGVFTLGVLVRVLTRSRGQ